MNTFSKKVTSPRQMEYLIVDSEFNIIEKSFDVERFADCPEQVAIDNDVRLGFPEFFGLEDILNDILEGRQISFDLDGVARYVDNKLPLYIDIHITKKQPIDAQDNKLIIFIKDVTSKSLLEQSLVQNSNETHLQLNSVETYKDYLDKILTSMPSFLLVTNQKGIIKTINRATKELFGYQENELVNQSISMIFPEAVLLHTQNNLNKANKNSTNIEVVCQTKTETKIVVAFSGSVVQTDIDDLEDFIYIGRDITENKRLQQHKAVQYAATNILSESTTTKQAFPALLQALCESLDLDIGEIWTPQNLETLAPKTSSSLKCVATWAQPGLTSLAKDDQQLSLSLTNYILSSRSPKWVNNIKDLSNIRKLEPPLLEVIQSGFGFPLQDEQENFGVMIFLTQKIANYDQDLLQVLTGIGSQLVQFIKHKEAESALLESEERYRDLFENATDLIQCVTADGSFVYVNQAWRETLGYDEAEIAELKVFDVIHPSYKSQCIKIIKRVMSGEKIERIQAQFITKNQEIISLEGNINCKFVEGKPTLTRGIFRDITKRLETEAELRHQRDQTEKLLLNILPSSIAERLKEQPGTIADNLAEVTVMFADIVGFTELSAQSSPTVMVELLNEIFSEFDHLAERHKLEKIKTIGDAYMVVGGLPNTQINHTQAIAEMALDMLDAITTFCQETGTNISIRIGINTGPVVAGVIGIKKFTYDLWGDTVNIASRMESHGIAGKIQLTESTYKRLQGQYQFENRGMIAVKGKGEMNTYFLKSRKN
jgi:adenylate cyclase